MKIRGMGLAGFSFRPRRPKGGDYPKQNQKENEGRQIVPRVELITVMEVPKHTPATWLKLAGGGEPVIRTSGCFSGPHLNGVVIENVVYGKYNPGRQVIEVVARAEMLTHDGAKIYKTDNGSWRGTEGAIGSLISGESVAVSQFYFMGVVKYAVSAPRYAWLKKGDYLSHGAIDGDKFKLSQYRVVDSMHLAELKARLESIRSQT
jgi:hypothetical protein